MPIDRTLSTHLSNYRFGDAYIGRLNEDSALTSAHPDDCALFAGPPRLSMIGTVNEVLAKATGTDDTGIGSPFKLFGTFQSLQFSNSQTVVPAKAIGSSRYFFFTSNNPVSFGFATIFMKVDSLAKVIYNNLLGLDLAVGKGTVLDSVFGGKVFNKSSDILWTNLEAELFSIPFGLGVLWSNKERSFLGSIYFENALITNVGSDITSGRQMIMENGAFIADRVLPMDLSAAFNNNQLGGVADFSAFRDEVKQYFGIK